MSILLDIELDALDSLTPKERHEFHKLVRRLREIIYPHCTLEISWAGGETSLSSSQEWVSGYRLQNTKPPELRFYTLLSDSTREVRFERVAMSYILQDM